MSTYLEQNIIRLGLVNKTNSKSYNNNNRIKHRKFIFTEEQQFQLVIKLMYVPKQKQAL